MDPELLAAYTRTEYRVQGADAAFVLRIGVPSPALLACHRATGKTCSAFITACNPHSRPTALDLNRAAMDRLERAVETMGLRWLHGEGVDPDGTWPGEPSLLVPGLEEVPAIALARQFHQNALVWAGADATPRLVIVA